MTRKTLRRRSDDISTRPTSTGGQIFRHDWFKIDTTKIEVDLALPSPVFGWILFDQRTPLTSFVARGFNQLGLATMRADLCLERRDTGTYLEHENHLHHLLTATAWLRDQPEFQGQRLGYMTDASHAGHALHAVSLAEIPINSLVVWGQEWCLPSCNLPLIHTPTLFFMDKRECRAARHLNKWMRKHVQGPRRLLLIPGIHALMNKPEVLSQLVSGSAQWFDQYLRDVFPYCADGPLWRDRRLHGPWPRRMAAAGFAVALGTSLLVPEVALAQVQSEVTGNKLTVTGDANDNNITITCDGGSVKVNGNDPDSGAEVCLNISEIEINAGAGNDTIDLTAIDEGEFAKNATDLNASGVLSPATIYVDAGDGNDNLDSPSKIAVEGYGQNGHDTFMGSDGNDTLHGGGGDDVLFGNGGDDTIFPGASTMTGYNDVDGGPGNDTIVYGSGSENMIDGGPGSNTLDLSGSSSPLEVNLIHNYFEGFGGGSLNNIGNIIGTPFNDILIGSAGDDNLDGGAGYDRIEGGGGQDLLFGNLGNDTLLGGDDDDTLSGGPGNDSLDGGEGINQLNETGDANYTISNTLLTGLGNDTLVDLFLANLTGGSSNNTLDASLFSGDTTLQGLGGNDTIIGGPKEDSIDGGDGNDSIYGGGGANTLSGLAGDDTISALGGPDLIFGNQGVDSILAGGGSDTVYGGPGSDILSGGDDNDVMWGDLDNDTINGGTGSDMYTLSTDVPTLTVTNDRVDAGGSNYDVIVDIDRLDLTFGNSNNIVNLLGSFEFYTLYMGSGNDGALVLNSIPATIVLGPGNDVTEIIDEDNAVGTDDPEETVLALKGAGNGLQDDVTLDGGGGNDTLVFIGSDDADAFNIGTTSVEDPATGMVFGYDNFEALEINAGDGDDTVRTVGLASVTQSIDGDASTGAEAKTLQGDELIVDGGGQEVQDTGTQILIPDTDPINYANVETVTLENAIVPNQIPTAVDDETTTDEETAADIDVLANDTDPDSDALTVTDVSDPANGTATINADGTVNYTPDPGFTGTDTFTYTISDGQGGTDQGTVTVTVSAVNDVPVAADDEATTDEETAADIDVLVNDTDPDSDALTVTDVSDPVNGTATINADGTVNYTPDPGFTGTDTFTYTISDGRGGTAQGTVTVTVNAVNDAPEAAIITSPDAGAEIVVAGDPSDVFVAEWNTVSDPEGDPVTYKWQLATSADFSAGSILIEEDVGSATRVEVDYGTLGPLLTDQGIATGSSITLYHRVMSSDGQLTTASTSTSLTFTRGALTDVSGDVALPEAFALLGNYPNPFNPLTIIRLDLPESSEVGISIYDVMGRLMKYVPVGRMSPGSDQAVQVEMGDIPSGLYVYHVTAVGMSKQVWQAQGNMLLVK